MPQTELAPAPVSTAVAAPEPLAVAQEPADLIVVGRLTDPGPLMDKLGQWSGFPLPWQEIVAERFPQLRDVLVVDSPTDFAVSLEPTSTTMPQFLAVVSVPLSDVSRGMKALESSGQSSSDEDGRVYVTFSGNTECTVARANGPTPARLVCGTRQSLAQLTSFAATNLPTQTVGDGDVFAELRLRPIHARYGKRAPLLKMAVPMLLREASLQNARFDAALADAAHALTDDVLVLVNEADKISIGVDLNASTQEAVAEVDFLFRGDKSFLPAAVAHAAKGSGAPPASFWSLPGSAEGVTFTASSLPFERLQGVSERVSELLAGALEHAGLASGAIDAWVAEFKALLNAGGASAFAHLRPNADAPPSSLSEIIGCEVGAIEGDNGAVVRFLDATVRVVNDAKLRAELTARLGEDLKRLPTVSTKPAPARWKLPAGAKLYSLTLPAARAQELAKVQLGPDAAKKQGALPLQLVAVSQNNTTWVAWGSDEALLVQSLQRVLSGSDSASVAQNPALTRWRNVKAVTGSSFKLREFLAPSLLSGSDWMQPSERQQLQRAMPHGGEGFVHLELQANEQGPLSTLRVIVPRTTVEDIAALAVSSATASAAPAAEETPTPDHSKP